MRSSASVRRWLCAVAVGLATCSAGLAVAQVPDAAEHAKRQFAHTYRRMIGLEIWVPECQARFPALAAGFDAALHDWEAKNVEQRRLVETVLAKMHDGQHPDLLDYDAGVRESVRSDMNEGLAIGTGQQVCEEMVAYLSEQADGGPTNFPTAVGFYYQRLKYLALLEPKCAARYPEHAEELARNRSTWTAADATVTAAVRAEMARTREEESDSANEFEAAMQRDVLGLVDQALALHDDGQYCRKTFQAMAAGDWRQQNARLYQILENGPSAD
jgi:hypothetical protein